MTQEQAARELFTRLGDAAPSLSWLSKLESDVYEDGKARVLGELARIYGCTLEWLVFGEQGVA
jgi:transcriptional regulator with XRE-family HTH domain